MKINYFPGKCVVSTRRGSFRYWWVQCLFYTLLSLLSLLPPLFFIPYFSHVDFAFFFFLHFIVLLSLVFRCLSLCWTTLFFFLAPFSPALLLVSVHLICFPDEFKHRRVCCHGPPSYFLCCNFICLELNICMSKASKASPAKPLTSLDKIGARLSLLKLCWPDKYWQLSRNVRAS